MANYMVAVGRSASPTFDGAERIYLIIQPERDGVHLVVYTDDVFDGDSWHESAVDAQAHAAEAYGVATSDWRALQAAQTCTEALAAIREREMPG